MSIRTRIALFGLAVVTLAVVLFCLLVYELIAKGIGQDRDKQLATQATAAVASLSSAPPEDLVAGPSPLSIAPIDAATSVDPFLIVLDTRGRPISSTGAVAGKVPAIPDRLLDLADTDGSAVGTVSGSGPALRVHVRPWHRADLDRSGYVVAAQSVTRVYLDRLGVRVFLVIAAIVAVLAAAIAIWIVLGRALRPLRQMATIADEIGRSHDLDRRLPDLGSKDALGGLSASFNGMLDRLAQAHHRLEAALAAQQRFTADASHELRTPLTTIRNNAGFLLKHDNVREDDRAAALRDIAGESERMSRLVENLLVLARADAGQRLRRDPVDLGELAEAVSRQAQAQHPDRQVRFARTPAPSIAGDEDALRQLLWILIDNAVKHTSAGGTVWVTVTQRGSSAQLNVADDGCGIPPGDEQRIFERFFRADAVRGPGGGAGLGLAIASWVVDQHGGHIMAANNDRGGATFVAELPAASPAVAHADSPAHPAVPAEAHTAPGVEADADTPADALGGARVDADQPTTPVEPDVVAGSSPPP
ncbi:MAG TPA: HAMP domain-containing sensor histidine kinase [Actinomycetes bacterium]|nr:HAMP domain-containing sensor histidine kinase [Actinomycetes bacterium]